MISKSPAGFLLVLLAASLVGAGLHAQQPVPGEADIQLTLPPEIYAVPGVPMTIDFANVALVAPDQSAPPRFVVKCDSGAANETRWTLDARPEQAGARIPLEIEAFDPGGRGLGSVRTTVRVAPADAGKNRDVSLLIIGDSLTAATIYPNEIAKLLNRPGNPAWRMLGTQKRGETLPGVAHEGYGGWTWKRFRTQFDPAVPEPGKTGVSPFLFAPDTPGDAANLDLARYFAERGGTGAPPTHVVIMLGINDCFHPNPDEPAAVEAKIDEMFVEAEAFLAALRRAAPEAEIGLCLTTPGNARDAAFAANYKDRYTRWGWRRIQHRLVKRQIARFAGREPERLFVIPTETHLDVVAGYPENNAVHPNTEGYAQIAASIYSWLKWRLAAVEEK
ncbi:MAG: SGNH/GDSL hydrolase family protein [Verrucomicrobiae bacterium]|nr:SGNH/GDSL hydrolase family protein [Verrucomicrobiae bacterium]